MNSTEKNAAASASQYFIALIGSENWYGTCHVTSHVTSMRSIYLSIYLSICIYMPCLVTGVCICGRR